MGYYCTGVYRREANRCVYRGIILLLQTNACRETAVHEYTHRLTVAVVRLIYDIILCCSYFARPTDRR
jgi:hypothetical protein